MSMVFQSYAIWPHMTVFDNVAYGLRVRNESGAALKEKVQHALELVKMGPYAERNASALSGGQQQRVALARAIAFSPSVILFDEPLSNLDAKLRSEMRIELRELQRRLGVTSLYVTHDLEEALAMSDRIVVMRTGVVEQSGTPAEIYDYPRTEFVADFIGSANLVSGEVVSSDDRTGTVVIRTAGGNVVHGVTHGRPVGAARHALHSHRPLQACREVRRGRDQRVAGADHSFGFPRRPDASSRGLGRPGDRRPPDRAAGRRRGRGRLSPCGAEPMRLARIGAVGASSGAI